MQPFKLNTDLLKVTNRQAETSTAIMETVREILSDIKANGDAALRQYIERFDGYTGTSLLASPDEIVAGVRNAGEEFMGILQRAAAQITEYHTNQTEKSWGIYKDNGVILGQLVRPLSRVALYVPGGTAALPSTVLMTAIPAQLAGVEDLAIFTPVKADGKVPDVILAAAASCGINKIYKIGGAQAIAAAAYGTETIEKADKIVGPGNIYVATA
ncbi:MAG: histidinol dehydrogenase, partial [Firmicutes bacterium]|nr:histidinol dehydrogenase [Bacillota bacterium]